MATIATASLAALLLLASFRVNAEDSGPSPHPERPWASLNPPRFDAFEETGRPGSSVADPEFGWPIGAPLIGPTGVDENDIPSVNLSAISDDRIASPIAHPPVNGWPVPPPTEFAHRMMPDGFGASDQVPPLSSGSEITCRYCGAIDVGQPGRIDYDGFWVCEHCTWDVGDLPSMGPVSAFRIGGWAVRSEGSPTKIGEFQDLESSPFWDLDGIYTDGARTLDYSLTGLDNEANNARAYFYGGPAISLRLDYKRYLRRLNNDPLNGFDANTGVPGPTDKVVSEDLNVGEDYAIRVQQLDARLQGRLTKNLKWKLDLWGLRKSGERQANAMAHCFNVVPPPGAANYTCHVLSQRQTIDWRTVEVTPRLEARLGKAVVEYSRTMRAFGQNDGLVTRTYTAFDYSPVFGTEGSQFVYGWVPDTLTQVDRLKFGFPVDRNNQVYGNVYLGNTENKFRDTRRDFYGYDLRLTNTAVTNVTSTLYAKLDGQNNEIPTVPLTNPPFGIGTGSFGEFEPSSLRHPIDYNNTRVGFQGKWRLPAANWLSMTGGYEFRELSRDFADYTTLSGPFTQQDTQSHQIRLGTHARSSRTLTTLARYSVRFVDNPLIGVGSADGKFNTNQPEQEHRVEVGGTWSPSGNFMATTSIGIENSWHDSPFANYDEARYPIIATVWYAPSARASITAGYAFFSNWIDQDITIGFLNNPTETTRWNYDGYNNLISLGGTYAWTERADLVGGVEWNRGVNEFFVPPSTAGADWTALPTFSDVIVETTRINLGIDYELGANMSAYFRYVFFDYKDISANIYNGKANMFLTGVTILR